MRILVYYQDKLIYVSDFRNVFINFARPTYESRRFTYCYLNKQKQENVTGVAKTLIDIKSLK